MNRRRHFTVRTLFATTAAVALVLAVCKEMSAILLLSLMFILMMMLDILRRVDVASLDVLRHPDKRPGGDDPAESK